MISRIAKYTIHSELGRGGFGRVYRGWDPDVQQWVAIKVLLGEGDPDLARRFKREVVTMGSLHHKNIITIYGSGEESGTPYLIMELLEGVTLSRLIKEHQSIATLEKVRIMTQVAEGLAYAHGKGVVHRDIKPSNIMLLADGTVKIMDFGIALAPNRLTVTVTMEGRMIGTLPYMAPEQFPPTLSKANEQTDIFSFGDVYYELLTGVHPFMKGESDLNALQAAVQNYEPAAVCQLQPGIPEALELLVHRALAKDHEIRYQSFEGVLLDSQAILIELQQERAATILNEVDAVIAGGELEPALQKVREVLKLEPGNRRARQLRERIEEEIRRQAVRKKVASLIQLGESHFAERRFADAVQAFESAKRLDPKDQDVFQLLANAKTHLEMLLQANKLVAEARFHQQKGKLPGAVDRLERALTIDPDHTDAKSLLVRVSGQLTRQQNEIQLQNAIRVASEHLAAGRFDQALEALDYLETQQPGVAEAAELRERIAVARAEQEERLRAESFNRALAETQDAIKTGELTRAGEMLERLSASFGDVAGAEQALSDLRAELNAQLRADEVAGFRRNAGELLKAKAFAEAVELLANALLRYPDDSGLQRLSRSANEFLNAEKRAQAVREVLARCEERQENGDSEGALEEVERGRLEVGDDPALADLARRLRIEIEDRRYASGLDELLKTGRELAAAGKYDEAIARLEAAGEYTDEAEVQALLAMTRSAESAQRQASAVAEALTEAETQRARGNLDEAEKILSAAAASYPHNSELSHAADRLRRERQEYDHRALVENERAAILRHVEERAWRAAELALRRARLMSPGEAAFDDLAAAVEAGLFEESMNDVAAQVRESLKANDLPRASIQLEETRTIYAGDPRWKSLEREVGERHAYESALNQADQHRKNGEFDKAAHLLQTMVQGAPDLRATQMFDAVRNDAAVRASRLVSQGQYGEALEFVETAVRDLGETVALADARENARRALEDRQRAAAIEKIKIEANELASQGRPDDAVRLLREGLQRFPNAADLSELESQCLLAQTVALARMSAEKRASEAIAAAQRQAKLLRAKGDYEGAEGVLVRALEEYPKAEALLALLEEVRGELRKIAAERDKVAAAAQSRVEAPPAAKPVRAESRRQGSTALKPKGEVARGRPTATRSSADPAPNLVDRGLANRNSILRWAGIAAAAIVVFFVAKGLMSPSGAIPVNITSDAAGASVSVGGKTCVTPHCVLRLVPGTYLLNAKKDGFQSITQPLTVSAQRSGAAVPLTFAPLALAVQVNTNFESGSVFLDGRAAGDLRDGQLSLPGIGPGLHTIRVADGGAEFQTEWRSTPGHAPELLQPITAKDMQAAVLTNAGETGKIACNCDIRSLSVDGAAAGQVTDGSLKNLKEGSHRITIAGRSLVVAIRPNPTLDVFLNRDRNNGTIVVETGEDDVRIYLNDKLYRNTTEHGALRIPADIGTYSVRAQKDGFRTPAAQTVDLKKGDEQRVVFAMTAVLPVLEIAGALPGAQVKVDGAGVGQTDAKGALRAEVTPGKHVVELTKGDYTPVRFTAQFTAGKTTRPERSALAMARASKAPDPKQIEAQDFERIRNSANPADFDDFIRRHADGAHADEAKNRASQLRQQKQVDPTVQAEQAAWDGMDKGKKAALQDFLTRFGNGAHAADARGLLVGIEKQEADAAAAAQRDAAARTKDAKDKEQEAANRASADEQAITRAIGAYEAAFNAKDLKALESVYSNMPKATVDNLRSQFKDARSLSFQLRPAGRPTVSGNSATVDCTRSLSLTLRGTRVPPANDRVRVILDRAGSGWMIRSITPY